MTGRSLSRLALVLVVLFATLVASALLPIQLFDAAWQLRLAAALINAATLPLLALALLQIAISLDPGDRQLRRRWHRFTLLAVVAALGFLLLVPLQLSASLALQASSGSARAARLDRAERQLADWRQAVAQASSATDLQDRLRRLQGPALPPADRVLPLPLLRSQVNSAFDQAQRRLERERSALPSADPLRLLPEGLRSSIAALALSCGFAIFARWPGAPVPLLDGLLGRLHTLHRHRRSSSPSEAEYIRQLSAEQQERP